MKPLKVRHYLYLLAIFAVTFAVVYLLREHSQSFFSQKENNSVKLTDIPILTRLDKEYTKVTESVLQSVVSLDTLGRGQAEISRQGTLGKEVYESSVRGAGSGVIVSKYGHIITNNHVIDKKHTIKVTLSDGRTFDARKIGEDRAMDLAVLKIDTEDFLTPLAFGDSDKIRVGQIVFAVGNPFGLGETVTQGIISAKQRSFGDLQSELIQTDAPINPGNSGGPLVNIKGEIIGINAAIYSNNKGATTSQGLGFSIPSNLVKTIFEEICEYGKPIRGYMGAVLMELTPQIKKMVDFDKDYGVAIYSIHEDSPAYKSGLRVGDIILSIGGVTVYNARELLQRIHSSDIGKPTEVVYWRNDRPNRCHVTVAEAGLQYNKETTQEPSALAALENFGLVLKNLNLGDNLAGLKGVLISNLTAGTRAKGLFLPGDCILSIDGQEVHDKRDINRIIGKSQIATIGYGRGRRVNYSRIIIPQNPGDALPPNQNTGTSSLPALPELPETLSH